jgi:glycosyltransferase involved in cell wall biosynthesis
LNHPVVDLPQLAGPDRMRLAYLTTAYPKVSHTFIRREIVELERRGHEMTRLAIHGAEGVIADPADQAEAGRTFVCLAQSPVRFAWSAVATLLRHPIRSMRALATAISLSRPSDRGLLRHLAYLLEAMVLLRHIAPKRIEHLHVHFGTNAATVALLMRILGGPPFSFTVHGPTEYDAPIAFSLGRKIAASRFVVAITHFGRSQLSRWVSPRLWERIRIVHCGVSEEFLADGPEVPDVERFVNIGRLTPQKGQVVLLEALALLRERGRRPHLVLGGDGEMRPEIEAAIDRLGLRDQVTITGWISEAEVRRHLAESRCMVLPSFAEGLPVVIMEALAMRRPVISTYIAGIPELVVPGEVGWLAPASDASRLAECMLEALDAPVERLRAMGSKGRELVRERHRVTTETAKLEDHFREAIAQAAGVP